MAKRKSGYPATKAQRKLVGDLGTSCKALLEQTLRAVNAVAPPSDDLYQLQRYLGSNLLGVLSWLATNPAAPGSGHPSEQKYWQARQRDAQRLQSVLIALVYMFEQAGDPDDDQKAIWQPLSDSAKKCMGRWMKYLEKHGR